MCVQTKYRFYVFNSEILVCVGKKSLHDQALGFEFLMSFPGKKHFSNEFSWEDKAHDFISAGEKTYLIYCITEGRQNQSPVHRCLQIPSESFSFIDLLCFPHSCNKS